MCVCVCFVREKKKKRVSTIVLGRPKSSFGFLGGSKSKESACLTEYLGLISGLGRSPGGGHVQTHSSFLAWRIPRTEEPGGLQFMRLQRNGHNSVTKQQ